MLSRTRVCIKHRVAAVDNIAATFFYFKISTPRHLRLTQQFRFPFLRTYLLRQIHLTVDLHNGFMQNGFPCPVRKSTHVEHPFREQLKPAENVVSAVFTPVVQSYNLELLSFVVFGSTYGSHFHLFLKFQHL